jgi:hypothetical protein
VTTAIPAVRRVSLVLTLRTRSVHRLPVPGWPCSPRSRTERRGSQQSTGAQNRRYVPLDGVEALLRPADADREYHERCRDQERA